MSTRDCRWNILKFTYVMRIAIKTRDMRPDSHARWMNVVTNNVRLYDFCTFAMGTWQWLSSYVCGKHVFTHVERTISDASWDFYMIIISIRTYTVRVNGWVEFEGWKHPLYARFLKQHIVLIVTIRKTFIAQ